MLTEHPIYYTTTVITCDCYIKGWLGPGGDLHNESGRTMSTQKANMPRTPNTLVQAITQTPLTVRGVSYHDIWVYHMVISPYMGMSYGHITIYWYIISPRPPTVQLTVTTLCCDAVELGVESSLPLSGLGLQRGRV